MLKSKWLWAAAAAMLIGSGLSAQAGYVVTLEQVGNNVVATGSGPLDVSNLAGEIVPGVGVNPILLGPSQPSFIHPSGAEIFTGVGTDEFDGYGSDKITGPSSFWAGGSNSGSLAVNPTGDFVGFDYQSSIPGFPVLLVPLGYVSNVPLSDSAIYANQTFDTMEVVPGTYEWTWGTGPNQNFTLQIGPAAAVPEPSSLLLLGGALAGLLVVRSRRRVADGLGGPAQADFAALVSLILLRRPARPARS